MVDKIDSTEPLASAEIQQNTDVTENPEDSPKVVHQQPDAYTVKYMYMYTSPICVA